MSVQTVPSVPQASGRTRQWYAELETNGGPIRGTGTGTRASWIEIDGFDIDRVRDRHEPGPESITLRVVKLPDLATPGIHRVSALGTSVDVRMELVERGRTAVTATMRDARILDIVILPNGREQFELVVSRLVWKQH